MKICNIFLFITLLFGAQSCSTPESNGKKIGIDPTFFPLNLSGQALNVFAFSKELLDEIAKLEKIELNLLNLSWDNLIESLYLDKTEAVLSSAPPNLINQTKFSFSSPLLKTGPVLIVPKQNKKISLKDLSQTVVAIGKSSEELELMQNYPNIEFIFYNTDIQALEGVESGKYGGCLLPILTAHAYVKDLFNQSLMISSDVLTNGALRLITIKDKDEDLLKLINKGIEKLEKNGTYQKLIDKWSLYQESTQ